MRRDCVGELVTGKLSSQRPETHSNGFQSSLIPSAGPLVCLLVGHRFYKTTPAGTIIKCLYCKVLLTLVEA